MHILISCKITNLDVHGEAVRKKIAQARLSVAHLKRLQADHDQHHRSLEALLGFLEQQGISYVEVQRGQSWPDLKQVDAVISVGGDGTVLEASHHILDTSLPILGIRSSSMSVGHLCACEFSTIATFVTALAEGRLTTRQVERLRAKINFLDSGTSTYSAPILNDFLYANANPAATTRYQVRVGEQSELQKSSGIWVATAAGSTAGIYAAGGTPSPISDKQFQYLVREPFCPPGQPRPQNLRGRFSPEANPLFIENHCEHAILALDGQHGQIDLHFGDSLTFERASPLALV